MTKFLANARAESGAKDNNGCMPLCVATVPNRFGKQTAGTFEKKKAATHESLESNGGKLE